MIKIGFITEGKTERIFLESEPFKQLLQSLELESLPVINANGAGNLLPHNIAGYIDGLERQGAEFIFILTDLDEDLCITKTKERIRSRLQDFVIVAVKKIEAWFLASTATMQKALKLPDFEFENPENEYFPFELINGLLLKYTGRGVSLTSAGKIKLVNLLLQHGLSLTEMAKHPNCPSARYFLNQLQGLKKFGN